MAIQPAILVTTTLISSEKDPEQRSQFISSIGSTPSAPAAPEIFDATHVTSSSVKSRGTVSGTSPYSLEALHTQGFPQGGLMCPCASPREPHHPFARSLCIGHPGGYTIPPPCWLPDGRPASAYQKILYHGSFGIPPHPPPLLQWRPCPPWQPLLSQRLLPVLDGDPYPRGPSAWLSYT